VVVDVVVVVVDFVVDDVVVDVVVVVVDFVDDDVLVDVVVVVDVVVGSVFDKII